MRCIFITISFFFYSFLLGQPLLFENYSSEQGLSQNSCYSIEQDENGFMWFGTQDGLNRYDGKHFKVFLQQDRIGKKLPSNYISSLFFDKHKKFLWIGTIRGACIYQSSGDSLAKISQLFPFAAQLETIAIKKIISFKANEYWVVSFNKGLLLLNTAAGTITSFFDEASIQSNVNDIVLHDGKVIVALLNELIYLRAGATGYQVLALGSGYRFPEIKDLFSYGNTLWVGTLTEGCFRITDPVEQVSNIKPVKINAGGIGCFSSDAAGNVWIGTRGSGIIRYNPITNSTETAVHDKYDNRSLGKNFVLSLFKDRQGIMWCGVSGNGVAKYDPLRYQFRNISNEPTHAASLPDNMIFDIFKSSAGEYYVGSQNKGIAKWDKQSNQFYRYPGSSTFGATNNTIYDITEDEQQNIWIASWGGLMQLNHKTKQISYKKSDLPASKKLYAVIKLQHADSLFIASESGPVFYSLKEDRWYPCSDIVLKVASSTTYRWSLMTCRYIYEDANSNLWICTVGAGLVRYNYKTQNFEVIEAIKNISIYARHLFRDSDWFWIATDNGVVVYDFKKKKIVRHIVPGNSMSSKVCYAIQKDKEGFFWVSTNVGLYRIDPQTFEVQKNYNLGNGLSFLEYNTACTFADNDGSILFGGVGGITQFDPATLKENTFSPSPLITAISVNDTNWRSDVSALLLKKLSFNYKQNFISLYFAVNNFSNQSNNQFAYRLKGLTDNWTNIGNRNFVSYTSLPAGQYVFQLRSANSDGKWSEGITELAININPPWWHTWWLRIAALLVLTGLSTYFVKRRIQNIRNEAAFKHKIAETEMMALRTQMNPHFIFNSLNSIREMILNDENKDASHYLSKFAQLMRLTLDQSSQAFVSLRSTLDYLHRYLEMEKIRNSNFTYSINVDEKLALDEIVIIPMLMQPFIENSIWHGTSDGHKNIHINITFKQQGQQLLCIIDDNGIGIEKSLLQKEQQEYIHRSVGISNIKNRISLLNEKYNLQSSVHIEDKSKMNGHTQTGTVVTLKLPITIEEE